MSGPTGGGASDDKPRRRHLNLTQKRALRVATVAMFARSYARKAQKNKDPNDRKYDRELEQELSRLRPEDLDRLLRDDEN